MKFSKNKSNSFFLPLAMGFLVLSLFGCHLFFEPTFKDSPPPPRSTEFTNAPGKVILIQLSEDAYLRKLSLHLRGFPPDLAEYEDFREAQKSKKSSEFLQKKVREYLSSIDHIEKMNHRLNELFGLRVDSQAVETWPAIEDPKNLEESVKPENLERSELKRKNAMNFIFREIVSKNLSWDLLLTSKNYRIFNPLKMKIRGSDSVDDAAFFRTISPIPLPQTRNIPDRPFNPDADSARNNSGPDFVDLSFPVSEERVAGVLSTARFFNRYPTTAVNRNRKRAAAVFRLFLCDDMAAVAVDQTKDQSAIFDLAFPKPSVSNSTSPNNSTQEGMTFNPHGQEPACLKCHYKLDPLGEVFSSHLYTLSSFSSPGALVYQSKKGQKISIPAQNLSELGKIITQQDDYASCQVKRFWHWFIGEDVELTAEMESSLVKVFNENGRRPNDLIENLVQRPEFWESQQEIGGVNPLTDVKALLRRCDSCHHSNSPSIPSFSQLPIGGSAESMKVWVRKISHSLDLDGDGSRATMPPRNSDWKMTQEERQLLKSWIRQGSPSGENL